MFFGGRRGDIMIYNFLAAMREVPERYQSVCLLPLSDWFISDHKRYTDILISDIALLRNSLRSWEYTRNSARHSPSVDGRLRC
jgi:hypothetical protein